MPRFWHKPSVLMTAYVLLFVIADVLASLRSPGFAPHQLVPDMGSPLIAAFFAWRVTRGGALSRGVIILYTVGIIQTVVWSADMRSGGLVGLGVLAIFLVQIALLV